jgi:hypothetical protein
LCTVEHLPEEGEILESGFICDGCFLSANIIANTRVHEGMLDIKTTSFDSRDKLCTEIDHFFFHTLSFSPFCRDFSFFPDS